MKELQRQASPNIVIALAGNKADLADKRLVEYEVISFSLLFLDMGRVRVVPVNEVAKMLKESLLGLIHK